MMQTPPPPKNKRRSLLFAIFFWIFNISLLLVVIFGFLPSLGVPIFSDAIRGEVPLSILIPAVGLVGVPTTSTVMGALHKKQKLQVSSSPQSITLFQIFFGMEAPLLMVCTIRLFFLRDLNPASGFIFLSAALGTGAFIHWCFWRRRSDSHQATWAHLIGLTMILILSSYLAAIALFYVPPFLFGTLTAFVFALAFAMILIIFFPIAVLLLGWVAMPFGMTWLFFKTWKQAFNELSTRYSKGWARACVAAVVALWIGGVVAFQHQPQQAVFQLLENQPRTDGDRQALLQKSEVIRQGLLNAYLSDYRYPASDGREIYHLYSWMDTVVAEGMQSAYSLMIAPFAYRGSSEDQDKAADLYAQFFDTPILRGEHSAIQKAVLSNFNRSEAKAGLLDINAERVHLEQQDITVKPNGDWAEVELHEIYNNQTFEDTEIFYYFSLPESAAITGLWLGETGDRAQRYDYTVSSRGAAQQVYTDQVQRRVDPALLEQVGPRNYRLRAFPIPPKGQDTLPEDGQPDKMHLWMTYRVMKQNNQWMMPILHEQRNIFWRNSTKRFVNGERQNGSEDWLPQSIPADETPLQSHQGKLPGGYIIANPIKPTDYQLPQSKRFAVILDGSYSMTEHRSDLEQSMQWLQETIVPSNDMDLFVTHVGAEKATKIGDTKHFDPRSTQFYGWIQPSQMLQQFKAATQAESNSYDFIIVMTDSGSYELTEDGTPVELDAPLWLVHLDGLQAAYDDATLEAIQRTGGSVTTDIKAVMERIATQPTLGEGTSLLNVVDGYAWFLSQHSDDSKAIDSDITPLAARQWITQVSQSIKPNELNQLDAIHQVAKDNSVVTPYSSMIVLVNDAQREQLKAAEEGRDRFDREVEDQQLPDPQNTLNPSVTGVPEPDEWLLIVAGLLILAILYLGRSQRSSVET